MKPKILFMLLCCFLLGTFTVTGLYLLSKSDQRDNSMIRIFPGHFIESEKVLDLGYNSWYLAGITNSTAYLGNTVAARRVLRVNLLNGDTAHLILTIPSINNYHFQSIQIKVDSPYIYLMDGTIPAIFRGNINNTEMFALDLSFSNYNQCVPIGPASFGLRIFNKEINGHSLAKTTSTPRNNSKRSTKFELHPEFLEKQGDGIFSVDGMFHYDKKSARFIYVYFYRNEFILMDSTLKLLYRGRTIDTTTRVGIRVDTIGSQHSITLSAPPVFVNNQSALSGRSLFILSDKLAKNESEKTHEENETIDMYNLVKGDYQFSFYMSSLRKNKIKNFMISNNKFIGQYDHYLVIRELNQKILNSTKLPLR